MKGPLESRLWAKVEKGEPQACWPWLGARRNKQGHGHILSGDGSGKTVFVHRVSYELAYGPIPEGLIVMHICDNPPCVNPAHLRLGTFKENVQDSKAKGRNNRGSRNGHAKLTEELVVRIREMVAAGAEQKSIAESLGVTDGLISMVVSGKRWSHVNGGGK